VGVIGWLIETFSTMGTKEAGMHLEQHLTWLDALGSKNIREFCKVIVPKCIWFISNSQLVHAI